MKKNIILIIVVLAIIAILLFAFKDKLFGEYYTTSSSVGCDCSKLWDYVAKGDVYCENMCS
jgi:hypothetical protein